MKINRTGKAGNCFVPRGVPWMWLLTLAGLFLLQSLSAGGQETPVQEPTPGEEKRIQENFAVFQSDEARLPELNTAVQNLAAISSPAVRARLLRTVETTGDERILYWTCRVLMETDKAKVAPVLIGRMEKGDEVVSERVIELLGETGDHRAEPVLIKAAQTAKTSRLRSAALKALAGTAGRDGAEVILKALDDGDAFVSNAASEALVMLASRAGNTDAIVGLLVGRLQKKRGEQAAVCLYLLGQIGGDVAKGAIRSNLGSNDPQVKDAAIRAAGTLRMKDAARDLVHIAGDELESKSVREAAVQALAVTGTSEQVPDLIPLLESSDKELKTSAHRTLKALAMKDLPLSTSAWEIAQAQVDVDAGHKSDAGVPPAPKSPESVSPAADSQRGISGYVVFGVAATALLVALLVVRTVLGWRSAARTEVERRKLISFGSTKPRNTGSTS